MRYRYDDIAHIDAAAFLAKATMNDDVEIHANAHVAVRALHDAWATIRATGMLPTAPMALVLYAQSREVTALQHFFPIITQLNGARRQRWLHWYRQLLVHTPIDIRFLNPDNRPAPLPLRGMVIGQVVSCFVDRPDILAAFGTSNPSFWLCANGRVYDRVGGVGGGCYDESAHRIILVAERLFEGYYSAVPGVCPLLHELGHLLDGMNRRLRNEPFCRGELPLMTAQQLHAWRDAKDTEVRLYQHYRSTGHIQGRAPLGHPYVFQTDGEFLAGHWELFWRNPHAFAQTAPDLYLAIAHIVNHDPRAYTVDYRGYVDDNTAFYARGEPAWPSAIRLHTNEHL
jgi:hypothetical protein